MMRDRFPGYYRPTEEQFKQMWQECIFSYDANILLNVYRFSPNTCEELFRIFEHLKDRTWLTHQAVLEYHENRQEVIEQQYNIFSEIEAPLMEASKKISERYSRRGHSFADTALILQSIDKFIKKTKREILKAQAKYPDRREKDELLERVTNIFSNIGEKCSEKQMKEIYEVAALRYSLQIPPGYKDKEPKKDAIKQYGDYVLWYQLIEYAKGMKKAKKPIIFAIDDTKEDWWKKEDGKTIGPRPELMEEMYSKAGIAFYMYNAGEFMKYAKELLGIKVEQRAIDEAVELGKQTEETAVDVFQIKCFNCGNLINFRYGSDARGYKILVTCPYCYTDNVFDGRYFLTELEFGIR